MDAPLTNKSRRFEPGNHADETSINPELAKLAQVMVRAAVRDVLAEIRKEGPPVAPEFLTADQAAIFLGYSVKALERMRAHPKETKKGKGENWVVGPKWRTWGKSVRYRLSDLLEWAERQGAAS